MIDNKLIATEMARYAKSLAYPKSRDELCSYIRRNWESSLATQVLKEIGRK